jgi:hypothetical protein
MYLALAGSQWKSCAKDILWVDLHRVSFLLLSICACHICKHENDEAIYEKRAPSLQIQKQQQWRGTFVHLEPSGAQLDWQTTSTRIQASLDQYSSQSLPFPSDCWTTRWSAQFLPPCGKENPAHSSSLLWANDAFWFPTPGSHTYDSIKSNK